MSEKKISFGFKLAKKQPLLLPQKVEMGANKDNGIELIQCLEGKTIKVLHEKEKEKPLVIPLLNAQKTSAALASLKNLKNVLDGENENEDEQKIVDDAHIGRSCTETKIEAQTIEQRVVAELLAEAKNADEATEESNGGTIAVPLNTDKLSFDGAIESSQDDYDRIPISQFGLGMLRGMGLKDEEIKSNRNKEPELRPRGMGLGADKAIKKKKLLVEPAANEVLEIKKNAYVRILAGKYRDLYGQIEGLDDQSCRVIVKLALGGKKETLNEFMVQPVSKQEYLEYGKVINSAKYEEYKRKQTIKEEKNTNAQKAKSLRDDVRGRHASEERFKHTNKQEKHQFGERSEGSWSRHRRSRSEEQDSRTTSKCDDKIDEHRHRSSDKRDDRREKNPLDHKRDKERRKSSSGSSGPSDSESEKRHHRKSSKKHKKKSSRSKHHDSDGDDDADRKRSKKKSKKRERSRSRGRR